MFIPYLIYLPDTLFNSGLKAVYKTTCAPYFGVFINGHIKGRKKNKLILFFR
jgi:hypothetical protein